MTVPGFANALIQAHDPRAFDIRPGAVYAEFGGECFDVVVTADEWLPGVAVTVYDRETHAEVAGGDGYGELDALAFVDFWLGMRPVAPDPHAGHVS